MKKLNIPSYSVLLPKENRIRAIQELYWGLNLTDEERAAVESGINKSLVDKLSATPVPQLLERKMQFQTIMESTEQLQCSEGYLYIFNLPVNTLNIALPEHEGNFLGSVIINMCTGNSPAITFYGPGVIRAFSKGFEIKANSAYEINCMYYGGGWVIAAVEIEIPETRVVATVNVTDTSGTTSILGNTSNISAVEIDGVEQQSVERSYTFSTTGEHTVKYTLTDPTSIGDSAFSYCSGLTSITIPDSVTSIGSSAFSSCTGLTSVTIGNGVTSIGENAFYGCSALTSITIGNSVTSIGRNAFSNCTGLTSIVVDSANTVFDSRDNCNAIVNTSTNELVVGCKSTAIPNTVTSIGDSAFYGCTGLTSVTIPNGVTSIGQSAFSNCTGLISVTIPNGVTSIGSWAFSGCTGVTSITIGNSVTSIGRNAFSNCTGLISVTIPNGVTSIGSWAFSGCSSLTSITSLATKAPTITSGTFQNVKTGGTLTVPSGSTGYDVWMGTGNYYLGKYSWTKVEQ